MTLVVFQDCPLELCNASAVLLRSCLCKDCAMPASCSACCQKALRFRQIDDNRWSVIWWSAYRFSCSHLTWDYIAMKNRINAVSRFKC